MFIKYGSNVLAIVIVLGVIYAVNWATSVPAVWEWMQRPANGGIVLGLAGFITNYAVKLSAWKGDDTLWNIVWGGIRKRLNL